MLVLDALRQRDKLIYNLGTGRGYSVREVVEAVRRVTRHPIPAREVARRAGDPAVLVAGCGTNPRRLAWQPPHLSLVSNVPPPRDGRGPPPPGYHHLSVFCYHSVCGGCDRT